MRFAGSRIEGFLGGDRTNFSAMAQKAGTMDSQERAAYTDMQGKVAATGINAAGAVEAAEITSAAAADAAQAQANGQMMSSLGGIASSAIGAFGGGGGGGGGALGGFGVTPATSKMDFSSAFNNPNFYSLS